MRKLLLCRLRYRHYYAEGAWCGYHLLKRHIDFVPEGENFRIPDMYFEKEVSFNGDGD